MGAQNRPQEALKGNKKHNRKKKNEYRRQEEHQGPQKEAQKVLTPFGPRPGGEQPEQFGRPRPLGAPFFARLDKH